MPSLPGRVHLVGHFDNGSEDVAVQVFVGTCLAANVSKDREILALRPNQRITLKMRDDSPCQIHDRSRLVFVSPIRPRISNRATPEKRVKLFEQLQISLIERDGERRPGLDPDLQLPSETEGYGETAFALRESRDEPWVQHGAFCDLHRNSLPPVPEDPVPEGTSDRRIVQSDYSVPHLSFRISRYGVNTVPPRLTAPGRYDFPRDCPCRCHGRRVSPI